MSLATNQTDKLHRRDTLDTYSTFVIAGVANRNFILKLV